MAQSNTGEPEPASETQAAQGRQQSSATDLEAVARELIALDARVRELTETLSPTQMRELERLMTLLRSEPSPSSPATETARVDEQQPSAVASTPDSPPAEHAADRTGDANSDAIADISQTPQPVASQTAGEAEFAEQGSTPEDRVALSEPDVVVPVDPPVDPPVATVPEEPRTAERQPTDDIAAGSTEPRRIEPVPASSEPAESTDARTPSRDSRRLRSACPAWLTLDTNQDGVLSGADRYWRHFSIWVDGNGDGLLSDDEIKDTFRLGLRALALDLRSYKGAKDSSGVVERRQWRQREVVRVELLSGAKGAEGQDYGMLALNVGAMVRGNAAPIRLDGVLKTTGHALIEDGLELESDQGWLPFVCP